MKKTSAHGLKTILITGTSTGIGYSMAKEFIRRNYQVFGGVRNRADEEKLVSDFGKNFIPLQLDVTDQFAIDKAVKKIESHLNEKGLDGLINNAGISIPGPVEYTDMDKAAYNFDVNVLGMVRVIKAFLPLLGTRSKHIGPPGRIINISSVSGKIAVPYLAIYTGTKHAVEGISHCLRKELLPFGIDVIIIGPAQVYTAIWDKASLEEFKNTPYYSPMLKFLTWLMNKAKKGISSDDCARRIADIFEKRKPKIRYSVLKNKFKDWLVPLHVPARMMDRYLFRRLS